MSEYRKKITYEAWGRVQEEQVEGRQWNQEQEEEGHQWNQAQEEKDRKGVVEQAQGNCEWVQVMNTRRERRTSSNMNTGGRRPEEGQQEE